ncbi:MAG: PucR family transcriptional regulator [Rhodococcus ruber]|nr:PucR family transcriptional regulator [Rhodococcus ruber]
MSVGIAWLLRQPGLGLTLRGGRAGMDRKIGFVQPTELLDPRPWLSGGELVLTIGLGLEPAAGGDYVRRLAEAGVAALGFGTGLSHERIPQSVLEAADAVGLALLEVPYTTPFAAVSRAVTARLAEQQYELVRRAADTQVRITRAVLRGGVPAVVRELAVATHTAVAYLDERTGEVAAHPEAAAELAEQIPELRRDGAGSVTTSRPGRTLTVQPVTHAGVVSGYLAVQADRPLENVELVLIGHAVSLVTLELDKPRRLRAERNALGAKVFGLLVAGALDSGDASEYLADAVGTRNRIRILQLHTPTPADVRRVLDAGLGARQRPLYARSDDETLTVLLRGEDTLSDVAALLADLSPPQARTLRGGLSAAHRLTDTRRAVEQAEHAVAAADAAHRLVEFDATHGTALLASPAVRAVLESVAASTVSALADYDRGRGTRLVASLRAFLEANGQWEAAAAALEVHRHTLRSRIAKAEQVLGVDLGDARVRAELLLALLIGEPAP